MAYSASELRHGIDIPADLWAGRIAERIDRLASDPTSANRDALVTDFAMFSAAFAPADPRG